MFTAIVSLCVLATIGLTAVHGLVLDHLPSLSTTDARSGPDLFIRFPITPAQNQSHARRAPFPFPLYNTTSIAMTPSKANFNLKRTPTPTTPNNAPTPSPTGDPDVLTTVHINSEQDFALLLPNKPGELISDAENDGVSYCSQGCKNTFPDGFITGSVVRKADDGSWIQITGCLNTALHSFAKDDNGGQFDVRFPNGAQCSFGGYGASFIEQIEPNASRFCLRCCSSPNDQTNCNSHQDKAGCKTAVPGVYKFGEVDCSS
jgi:hypothetical protein